MAAKTGRPPIRTTEMENRLLEEVADGRSVTEICAADDMPTRSTIFRWLAEDKAFSDLYARAKAAQAECLADELIEISDNGQNDWMERNSADNVGWVTNGEAIQRSRLRLDTRKWVASKLLPKKYGEKQTLEYTGKDGGAIEHSLTLDPAKLSSQTLEELLNAASNEG